MIKKLRKRLFIHLPIPQHTFAHQIYRCLKTKKEKAPTSSNSFLGQFFHRIVNMQYIWSN